MMKVNVLRDASFIDPLPNIIIFACVFEVKHHVSLSDAQINDVVDDMISFDFLTSYCNSTYVCCTIVTKLVFKQSAVPPQLGKLSQDGAGTGNLGVSYVDSATIYRSNQVDVKLMLQTADVFVKNPSKPSSFNSAFFQKLAHLLSQDLLLAHHSHAG